MTRVESMTNPDIKIATQSDATQIARFSRTEIEYGLGWSYTPARIKRAIANKSRNVIVASRVQRIAGFGIMSYSRDSANLDLLGVKREYRRMGFGESIVNWLEKSAATAGIVHHHIQVRENNRSAIALYSKLGYVVINKISGYYSGREAAILMYKYTGAETELPDVDIGRILNLQGNRTNRL